MLIKLVEGFKDNLKVNGVVENFMEDFEVVSLDEVIEVTESIQYGEEAWDYLRKDGIVVSLVKEATILV